ARKHATSRFPPASAPTSSRGWSFCSAGRSPTCSFTSRPRTRSCGITAWSSANATSSVRCARCKHIPPGRRDQYDKRRRATVAVCKQNAREITAPPAPDCHSYCYSRRAPSLPALFDPGQEAPLRNKAMAARPPANPPVLAVVPTPATPATVPTLGQQLRDVLQGRRLHSVSVCDHEANVLWLSEGALIGPDEHGLVIEGLQALAAEPARRCYETVLEDGRFGLLLPDIEPPGPPPRVQPPPRAAAAPATPQQKPAAARAVVIPPPISPRQVDDILEFDLSPAKSPLPSPRRPTGSAARSKIDTQTD